VRILRKKRLWIILLAATLLLLVAACMMYLLDIYPADADAIDAFVAGRAVDGETLSDGGIVYAPADAKVGVIFYGGGKVEHTAYKPLAAALAEQGILCVIPKMPFHLAVFAIDAADGIPARYPDVQHWYIGGHSLGGSMAASYAAEQSDVFDGVILLGSYSATDLSDSSLEVLSVYGSEDRVLNMEKYTENTANLPEGFSEIVFDGGCHAGFGMYGAQRGDGTPTLTAEEQILKTAAAIAEFVSP